MQYSQLQTLPFWISQNLKIADPTISSICQLTCTVLLFMSWMQFFSNFFASRSRFCTAWNYSKLFDVMCFFEEFMFQFMQNEQTIHQRTTNQSVKCMGVYVIQCIRIYATWIQTCIQTTFWCEISSRKLECIYL